MPSRIPNPALSVPGLLDALQSLSKSASDAASQAGLAHRTLELVNTWNRLNVITGQMAGEWTA